MLNDKLYWYRAELLSVTDGDTIKVRVDMGMRNYRDVVLRIGNINAPEKRGDTKEAGLLSKAAATSWLEGKRLVVRTERDPGSYDRYTAEVFDADSGQCLSEFMVKSGYAAAYHYKWD